MKYVSGEQVKVGDEVLIENGKTKGTVHSIVETTEDMKQWGLDEVGISIESSPFGLVFWPQSETDDPVVFVARGKSCNQR